MAREGWNVRLSTSVGDPVLASPTGYRQRNHDTGLIPARFLYVYAANPSLSP
jgi:hypothetical protein